MRNRRNKRIQAALDVEIEAREKRVQAHTLNVSAGGLLLLYDGTLVNGDEVAMRLVWGSETLALKGRVVHTHDNRVGVAFSSIDGLSRQQLRAIIESFERQGLPIDERRSYERGMLTSPLSVNWWEKDVERKAPLKNLSMSGALIDAESQLAVGTKIHIRLPLSDELIGMPTPMVRDGVAEVVRVEPNAFAIRFHEPSEQFLLTLAGLLLTDAKPSE